MDGLVDILITIGIFVIFFASSSRKLKKRKQQQQQQQSQRQKQRRPVPSPIAQSSYEEIPKTQSYFTYETFEPEIKENYEEENISLEEVVEKNVQNIDNENEKTPQVSLDMEEIYKGVIYSEILKRPYN